MESPKFWPTAGGPVPVPGAAALENREEGPATVDVDGRVFPPRVALPHRMSREVIPR